MVALRILFRVAAALVALCALYLAAALFLGFIPVNTGFVPTAGGIPVAVCSNGVHTDFVLPVKTDEVDWALFFPKEDFSGTVEGYGHVGIGWGNLAFYRTTPRWRDFRIGTALLALAGLGPAALHVQYRPAPGASENCATLAVSAAQYRALAEFITGTLATLAPVAPGYGTSDAFYPAEGRFSLVKSCNVWVDQGLEAAGLPAGFWTPFAFQVLQQLRPAAS